MRLLEKRKKMLVDCLMPASVGGKSHLVAIRASTMPRPPIPAQFQSFKRGGEGREGRVRRGEKESGRG